MDGNLFQSAFGAIINTVGGLWTHYSWSQCALLLLIGRILRLRFRSLSEIAASMGQTGVDRLHHFLHDSPWDERPVLAAQQRQIVQTARHRRGEKVLVIDDTPIPRVGKHIAGAGWHHGPQGLVWGQCCVSALVKIGTAQWVWGLLGYRPKRVCPTGEFRSKIDLAMDLLRSARTLGKGLTVLMDAWYACRKLLAEAAYFERYVAALKTNRLVRVNGRQTAVRNLAKGPRDYTTVQLSKKRKVRVAKCVVELPEVGSVALFICKLSGQTRYLISNDLALTGTQAVQLYAQRWAIETLHRDLKQHVGLTEMWTRDWQACTRHWLLCALAYNALAHWNAAQKKPVRTFGQIIRRFRAHLPLEKARRLAVHYRAAA